MKKGISYIAYVLSIVLGSGMVSSSYGVLPLKDIEITNEVYTASQTDEKIEEATGKIKTDSITDGTNTIDAAGNVSKVVMSPWKLNTNGIYAIDMFYDASHNWWTNSFEGEVFYIGHEFGYWTLWGDEYPDIWAGGSEDSLLVIFNDTRFSISRQSVHGNKYIGKLALTNDIPPAVTVVAPTTNAVSGQAADAKATGTALYTGFTEWACVPAEYSLEWSQERNGWAPMKNGMPAGDAKGDADSTSLSWQESVDASENVTATRHLITPEKTSQLANDGAPNGGGTPYATTAQIPTVPSAYASTPAMDGIGSAGSSTAWAKGDHVHPSDTSKANVHDLPYALVTPGEWETDADSSFDLSEISGPHYDDGWYYIIGLCFSQKFNSEAEAKTALTLNFVDPSGLSIPSTFTATRPSLPGHLLDRSINRVQVSSQTTLYFPSIVTNKSRDFILSMVLTNGSQSVTFTNATGEVITWAKDMPPAAFDAGTNIIRFTEVSQSCFLYQKLPAEGGGGHSGYITDGTNTIDAAGNVYVKSNGWSFALNATGIASDATSDEIRSKIDMGTPIWGYGFVDSETDMVEGWFIHRSQALGFYCGDSPDSSIKLLSYEYLGVQGGPLDTVLAYNSEYDWDGEGGLVSVSGTIRYGMPTVVGKLALTNDIPPAVTVVAPSTNAVTGQAADAKATGTALYTGFTEWVFSGGSSEYPPNPDSLSWGEVNDAWVFEDMHYESSSAGASSDDIRLIFPNIFCDDGQTYNLVATRHLITPTKISQLTNDVHFIKGSDLDGYLPLTGGTIDGSLFLVVTNFIPATGTTNDIWYFDFDGSILRPDHSYGYPVWMATNNNNTVLVNYVDDTTYELANPVIYTLDFNESYNSNYNFKAQNDQWEYLAFPVIHSGIPDGIDFSRPDLIQTNDVITIGDTLEEGDIPSEIGPYHLIRYGGYNIVTSAVPTMLDLDRLTNIVSDVRIIGSLSQGHSSTLATNLFSTASGTNALANGVASHAEGGRTTANGTYSHAEGVGTTASGIAAHSQGLFTDASERGSFAAGARANSSNSWAFVWSGIESTPSYGSHGVSTFNINPKNGILGFYVGNQTLQEAIVASILSDIPTNEVEVVYNNPDQNKESRESMEFITPTATNSCPSLRVAIEQVLDIAITNRPMKSLAMWTLPQYMNVVKKYEWDGTTCYRTSVSGGSYQLTSVTNINLTAIENIEALKAVEESYSNSQTP